MNEPTNILLEALVSIRDKAIDHPCCDLYSYDHRDLCHLVKVGGEVFDWTMIAIEADDAIRAFKEANG